MWRAPHGLRHEPGWQLAGRQPRTDLITGPLPPASASAKVFGAITLGAMSSPELDRGLLRSDIAPRDVTSSIGNRARRTGRYA